MFPPPFASTSSERVTPDVTGTLDFDPATENLWTAAAWLDGCTTKARQGFAGARGTGCATVTLTGCWLSWPRRWKARGCPTRPTQRWPRCLLVFNGLVIISPTLGSRSWGCPFGRGMVESACQWLIQQCFKGVGMRWSEDGFNHLVHWRLAWVNGHFESLFQWQPSPNSSMRPSAFPSPWDSTSFQGQAVISGSAESKGCR